MAATVIGAILFVAGLAVSFAGSGSGLFLISLPGGALFLVGLILQSNEKTRDELALIRARLDAMEHRGGKGDGNAPTTP